MAQSIATWRLSEALGRQAAAVDVSSAGTAAVVGASMEPAALAALARRGVPALPVRARSVQPGMVAGADLILTATREHRSAVARMLPQSVRRCFTIVDFDLLARAVDPAELPEGSPAGRGRLLVELAGRLRGTVQPQPPEITDLPDPYSRPEAEFRRCAERLIELTEYWPRLLAGAASA